MTDANKDMLSAIMDVAQSDVKGLETAQKSYGDSWKKRGGVGAYMMLARKWDRIENRVSQPAALQGSVVVNAWDIFEHIGADDRAEGLIDDIRDLRRYLLLVEAEMLRRGSAAARTKSRDNSEGAD